MTKDDLMQIYYIDKEIKTWQDELQHTNFSSETKDKIKKKLAELKIAKDKITNYILTIDDCQTRLIFKLRCLNLMTWNDVADRIGGMNSEYTVKKRFYRYLKKEGA